MLSTNIDEITYSYLLNTNINDLKNLCQTNKNIYELCNDIHFWYTKFEKNNLPLPKVNFFTIQQWIDCYQFTTRIMNYVDHVLTYLDKENLEIYLINDLSIFANIVDKKTLSLWYNIWYKVSEDYFDDIRIGYDDNAPVGVLVIAHNNNNYRFVLKVRQYYVSSNNIAYEQVVFILYHFISNYQYVHSGDKIIQYNFK
ncbi:MAG TPA: hypothetical protein VLG50_05180 [Candidatus Saccharimonadales bacterium]|nr:hypothetical protein [Candidatus Saccharimonadales bacterium]